MKLKLDDQGHAVLSDGKPIYVHDDGKEVAHDAAFTVATIGRLNAEAKAHREAKEAAEARLRDFDGIDRNEAVQAMATVKNLDAKKLVDAGDMDRVKNEAVQAAIKQFMEEKHLPVVKERDLYSNQLRDEKMRNAFSSSKYVLEKMSIPADMARSHFGQQFKVENDGRVVGYDANGQMLYSRSKPGETANFDEALESMVDQYQYREHILKGTDSSGSGSSASRGSHGGQDLSKLPPIARMDAARAQRK